MGRTAQLSDQQRQEIDRYLERGRPLPDKYRFLLFEDKREVELVWNGKTNEVYNEVLPFQVIEHVDEPRVEKTDDSVEQLAFLDDRGRQLKGWTNKLIWGDNKFILSSLKNGSMRKEIEDQGGLKLIYIDPPFDVGANFSMDIEIPPPVNGSDDGLDEVEVELTKEPNILEELAYRDTWGKGADSFVAMMYERLKLMRDLLAEDGSIYVHCDWRTIHFMRNVLDEVFGSDRFINEIIWHYPDNFQGNVNGFATNHNNISWYSKTASYVSNRVEIKLDKPVTRDRRRWDPVKQKLVPEYDAEGNIIYDKYHTIKVDDVWRIAQSSVVRRRSKEYLGYPTQKPGALLERIIKASSNEGDLVADFFCGSGTTAAVAERLGRKWIATDLGKFAIHTTRKRMIAVQRGLKASDKDYRAFEVLNLGKYERQQYIGINANLRAADQEKQLKRKGREFINLILEAYSAAAIEGSSVFQGQRAGRFVAIGTINLPVTRSFVEAVIEECLSKKVTRVDILAFEYEMGLFPNMLDVASSKGIDITPKCIPKDVFDKRAVERGEVKFYDVAYIDIRATCPAPSSVQVELTNFVVSYSQGSVSEAEQKLKRAGVITVVENGKVMQVRKDAQGIYTHKEVTRHWTQWIDYWSVDFEFESKKEIIRIQDAETGEWKAEWTGDYIFENEWQSFRTKRGRGLELISMVKEECRPGRRKVAVKVVDIFGNDTMKVVPVNVG